MNKIILLGILILFSGCAHKAPKEMNSKELIEYISDRSLMKYVSPSSEVLSVKAFELNAGWFPVKQKSKLLKKYDALLKSDKKKRNINSRILSEVKKEELVKLALFLSSDPWQRTLNRMLNLTTKSGQEELKDIAYERGINNTRKPVWSLRNTGIYIIDLLSS